VRWVAVLLAVGAAWGTQACAASTDEAGTCRTGGDCPSGACEAGRCVSVEDGTGGSSGQGGDAASSGGGSGEGGGTSSAGGSSGTSSGDGGGLTCSPEGDGEIRRDEVPLVAGFRASYLAATDAPFATEGTTEDGERVWDLDVDLPNDHLTLAETLALETQWFASVYPGASYAARLSEEANLLGVFEATDDALLLRGVVSPSDGNTRTELTYDPPVKILAFPLAQGDTWSTTTTITGLAQGLFVTYFESYENAVDARGTVITPYADFDSLRLRMELTRTVGALVTTQRTFAFVTECFGTVGRVVSQQNEVSAEFDDAAEI
jgi:hypothetical protein